MRIFTQGVRDPETLFVEADRKEEAGDFEAAFVRLLAAAKQGHAGSQINLGNYYADGRGVKKNLR